MRVFRDPGVAYVPAHPAVADPVLAPGGLDGAGSPAQRRDLSESGRGFGVGTTTAYRYLREAPIVLAGLALTLAQAVTIAMAKAYAPLDGTLLRTDRAAIASKGARASTRRTG